MLSDNVLAWGDVDAVDLVVGDKALHPLDISSSSLRTLLDFRAVFLSFWKVILPASGTSLSIMYLGIAGLLVFLQKLFENGPGHGFQFLALLFGEPG